MKQWIRWSGLAGFIAISAVLLLIWFFAVGPIIKYSIETFGSQAANAKVEIDSVGLTFDPFGIEIKNLQVANAEQPMENLLQFERAVADIELLPLLLGKGIVNEVALTGLAFSTPRLTSGALDDVDSKIKNADDAQKAEAKQTETKQAKAAAQQALPTADELLSREPLLTEQRGKALNASVQTIKTDADNAIAALPDAKALASYEQDFKRITSGRFDSIKDFQQRKKEFEALKKRIKDDQQAISHARNVLANGKQELQTQWSDLQGAPAADFNHLKSKYKLDGAGVTNLSRLLFGNKVGEWSQQGLYWYEKIRPFLVSDEVEEIDAIDKPMVARGEGRFIHYQTDRPLPDVLIRQARLAVQLDVGQVDITINDITHQQAVINKPTRITATGKALKGIESLTINGTLDHRLSPAKDTFDFSLKGMALNDYDVGAMGLKLDRSDVNLVGNVALVSGGSVTGKVEADTVAEFNQAKFSSKDKTQVAIEVAKALAKINRFDIQANATGDLTAPDVSIKSDLDSQLSRAFNQRLKEKQQALEAQLKKSLNDKLLSYAGDYKEQLNALDLANGSLADKQAKLKQLARSELSSFEEQKKADAKRELEQKKQAQRNKAKAERDKAKAKAEEKKKQLEKEAKDKLKKFF